MAGLGRGLADPGSTPGHDCRHASTVVAVLNPTTLVVHPAPGLLWWVWRMQSLVAYRDRRRPARWRHGEYVCAAQASSACGRCVAGPLCACVTWTHCVQVQLLCCAVLCCAVLCCAVLCCAVLCCAVLCCAVRCCAVLCVFIALTVLLVAGSAPSGGTQEKAGRHHAKHGVETWHI
jgi:hypothetical protein